MMPRLITRFLIILFVVLITPNKISATTIGPIAVPNELTPPAKFNRCAPFSLGPKAMAKGFAAVCCNENPKPTTNKAPNIYMKDEEEPASAPPTTDIITPAPNEERTNP